MKHLYDRKPKTYGVWCDACPYFEAYGDEYDLTARCKFLEKELQYYDGFIAECLNQTSTKDRD